MYLEELKELKPFNQVIIQDGSEWHLNHGIVQATYPELGFLDVFCIQKPTQLYRVYYSNPYIIRRDTY